MNTSLIRKLIYIVIALIIIGAAIFTYWFYFMRSPATTVPPTNNGNNGFNPFGTSNPPITPVHNGNNGTPTTTPITGKQPLLRLLSATPVGGYGASTTASTTIIRWVDRGRGNIYEANGSSSLISIISNTLVPRIYESWWNKNADVFAAQYLNNSNDSITTVLTSIIRNPRMATSSTASIAQISSSTASNQLTETAYQLKGKAVTGTVTGIAVSPKKDRLLLVTNEDNHSKGYISKFDGTGQVQIFDLPLSQIAVDWPEDNTITVETKAGSAFAGYLYFVNAKTGAIKQVLGGITGLSAKVSHDATQVFYSKTDSSDGGTFMNYVLDVKSGKTTDVIFRALAEKCVWGNKNVSNIYCGVSSSIPGGSYPDDWYTGKLSFIDSIWKLDTKSGQSSKMFDLLNQGNTMIDAYNMQLSGNDNFLYFMNKDDLSLWSLEFIAGSY